MKDFLKNCVKFKEWGKTIDGAGKTIDGANSLRVAISWPGYRWSKVSKQPNSTDVWFSTDMWFSTLLGKKCEPSEVERKIREQLPYCKDIHIHILSDFQTGILGEIRHPMGQMDAEQPSLLINIGTGVCVGFFYPETGKSQGWPEIKFTDLIQDNAVTHCSAVGRWLFYSLRTGKCQVGPSDQEKNTELVFTDDPLNFSNDRSLMRASSYLGARGLVARHMPAVAVQEDPLLANFPWREWCKSPLPRRLEELDKNEDAVHEGLRHLYRAIFHRAEGSQIVAGYAQDLAALVEKVTLRLEEFAKQRDADITRGPLTGDQLRVLARDCPKKIVLTGPVGQSLGLMFDCYRPAAPCGVGDAS